MKPAMLHTAGFSFLKLYKHIHRGLVLTQSFRWNAYWGKFE